MKIYKKADWEPEPYPDDYEEGTIPPLEENFVKVGSIRDAAKIINHVFKNDDQRYVDKEIAFQHMGSNFYFEITNSFELIVFSSEFKYCIAIDYDQGMLDFTKCQKYGLGKVALNETNSFTLLVSTAKSLAIMTRRS